MFFPAFPKHFQHPLQTVGVGRCGWETVFLTSPPGDWHDLQC